MEDRVTDAIGAQVDPYRGSAATSVLAPGENQAARAVLFCAFGQNPLGASILINILGSCRRRYVLAKGLDPDASPQDLVAQTRELILVRRAPQEIASNEARLSEAHCTTNRSSVNMGSGACKYLVSDRASRR
jgi:hypothetical protein